MSPSAPTHPWPPFFSNSTYSSTEHCSDLHEPYINVFLIPIMYVLICVLGTAGNTLVLFTVARSRVRPRRVADSYIASLALADLVFVLSLPLWAVYAWRGYDWPFGAVLCKLSSFAVSLNMYASVFCLTCLSFDRYVAVVHAVPAAAALLRSRTAAHLSLALVWLLALLVSLPSAVLRTTLTDYVMAPWTTLDDLPGGAWTENDTDLRATWSTPYDYFDDPDVLPGWIIHTSCDWDFPDADIVKEAHWSALNNLLGVLLAFLLPGGVMAFCYLAIARKLSSHFTHVRQQERKKRRLLQIIATLVLMFTLCWLPYHAIRVIDALRLLEVFSTFCNLNLFLSSTYPYTICLAYLNSCLNPFLYAFFDSQFRAEARRLLCYSRTTRWLCTAKENGLHSDSDRVMQADLGTSTNGIRCSLVSGTIISPPLHSELSSMSTII
uniref:apelin receptor A-like n=1 Tax=Myxine glutinosa TaxID=7769 RepID=UPI00358E158D